MKTSSFVIVLLVALLAGAGISYLALFGGRAATQTVQLEVTCPISVTDQDGDCLSSGVDYFPDDQLK